MEPRKFGRVGSLSRRSQGTKRDYSDQLAKGAEEKSQAPSKSRQRRHACILRLTWENSSQSPRMTTIL